MSAKSRADGRSRAAVRPLFYRSRLRDPSRPDKLAAITTGEREPAGQSRNARPTAVLFLDELRVQFETIRADRSTRRRERLEEFHAKLRRLRLLDPACGCGNFLVLAYRELRLLDLDLLRELYPAERVLDIRQLIHMPEYTAVVCSTSNARTMQRRLSHKTSICSMMRSVALS